MTRLQELLIFILDRTKKEGQTDLSRFQIFKIIYLLQVYSLKYAGTTFLSGTTFIREENGPISVDIYKAMEPLMGKGYIKKEVQENKEYGHPRHAFSLGKKVPQKLHFSKGEIIFLDSFLPQLLLLTQNNLKKKAYGTEPMQAILKKERDNRLRKGEVVDFSLVSVDKDTVDTYSDAV